MEEIVSVENWQYVPVDIDTGMPIVGAHTGSNPAYCHSVVRYIQLQDKCVHSVDGGDIVKKWDTRWEGRTSYTKWWDECSACGKKFNETDYE